jgi:predicted NBD/HSP70 family sugar kinase
MGWNAVTLSGHHEREMIAFRQRNASSCIEVLRDGGVLTLTELARTTGLSRPTVESIVAEFLEHGLVVEHPRAAEAGVRAGRPARQFTFNSAAAYAASVDLGLHRATVLISDLAGSLVGSLQHDVPSTIDGGGLIVLMGTLLRDAIKPLGITLDQLASVVVSVTGIVDDQGRVLQSNILPEWNGVNLAERFGEDLSCPVVVENDVNMAALAELHSGAAQSADDVVFVMVGHRISAAIILGGELHRGRNFAAGEVGDLESTGWVLNESHETSVLGAFLGRSPEDIFSAAEKGDHEAASLVKAFAQRIARGIAVVGLTVDPDLIVIGGGLSAAGDVLMSNLAAECALLVTRQVQPPMVASTLGMNGVALGGLVRALQLVSQRLYGSRDIAVPTLTIAGLPTELATAPFGTQLADSVAH